MNQRPIKFRVRETIGNTIYGYEKFEYGRWHHQAFDGNEFSRWYLGAWNYKNTIREQYTGLKDKNGKEIYEGDVVKGDGIYNDKKVVLIGKIEFEDGCFNLLWKWESPEGSETYSVKPLAKENKYLEVISNIYESKHLLDNIDTKR